MVGDFSVDAASLPEWMHSFPSGRGVLMVAPLGGMCIPAVAVKST
jgi:hypothetical protein